MDPTVAAAARELDDICRDIGFLVISNHGASEATQKALYDAGRTFFDLPLHLRSGSDAVSRRRPLRR